MDASTLLYRSRKTRKSEFRRKKMALRSAYSFVESIDPSVGIDEFLDRSIDLIGRVFGGSAHDSYLTTVMSVAATFSPGIDVYLSGVLNAVVMEMNFQTRIFIDGNQSVIFDGDEEYFPLSMLHGNVTLGIRICENAKAVELPTWANTSSALEINSDRLHNLPRDQVRIYQAANNCRHTGALLIVNPQGTEEFSVVERYEYLRESVGAETIYCLGGSAEMVFRAAEAIQQQYPDLRINIKGYGVRSGRSIDYRAIMLFSGLDQLPDIKIRPGVSRECTFGRTLVSNDECLTSISYGEGRIDGRSNLDENGNESLVKAIWEPVSVKRPFYLASSAPLPLEARERISDELEVLHSVLSIKDGILIPSQDSSHSTFLFATSDGAVIREYGSDPDITPLYANGVNCEDGVRRGCLTSSKLRRVKGAAMPLMFTPLLHKWHSHFLIQCLPRIKIIRDLGLDVTVLIPHDLRKKQLDMLELLGVSNNLLIKMGTDELIQADDLYYPWPWRLAFTKYSVDVYNEIMANVVTSHISTPKRILISRESRKSWRNLINYESVRQMLVEDYGFEVVAPEKLTLAEEVATYANAEIIVGAEGAGMYGAVFSSPATKYITICDEDYVMPILGSLASVRGFDIGYVFGESLRSDRDVQRRLLFGHADFVVDVNLLSDAVSCALSR